VTADHVKGDIPPSQRIRHGNSLVDTRFTSLYLSARRNSRPRARARHRFADDIAPTILDAQGLIASAQPQSLIAAFAAADLRGETMSERSVYAESSCLPRSS